MKFKFDTVTVVPEILQQWLSRPHHITMFPSSMTTKLLLFQSELSSPPHSHLWKKVIPMNVATQTAHERHLPP